MKAKDALLYCRQLLFELRLEGVWLGAERLNMALALRRWQDFPTQPMSTAIVLDSERQRWREELEHEQRSTLERGRRDARLLDRVQARLDAAERVVQQLRADNVQLREELIGSRQLGAEGELEQLRLERSQREEAGARMVSQEAVLRARLEAEQRRLDDSSAQLAWLERMADEDETTLRLQHTSDAARARSHRESEAASMRKARELRAGGGLFARTAWKAAAAQVEVEVMEARHEAELDDLNERYEMLSALRESRDALEWRVTQTKAQLIVMQSAISEHGDTEAALMLGSPDRTPRTPGTVRT